MIKKVLSVMVLFCSIIYSERYIIDSNHSELLWKGKKVTGEHYGTIEVENGFIMIEDGVVTSGEIVINMPTIKVTDIESEEWNKKLEDHLKNEDFFNVVKFPVSSFTIKEDFKIQPVNDWNIEKVLIAGDLEIRGIKIPTSIPMFIPDNNG